MRVPGGVSNGSCDGNSGLDGRGLHEPETFLILLGAREMFQDERRAALRDLGYVGGEIEAASSGHRLLEVDVHLRNPREVLAVARPHPAAEGAEALADERTALVEAIRGVDRIRDVEV